MKDENHNQVFESMVKLGFKLWVAGVALVLTLMCGAIFVAFHFVSKYW